MMIPLVPSDHPNQHLRKLGAQYDPDLPISFAFGLVGLQRGWKAGSETWKRNWNACMNCEYDRHIGSRVTTLATWQQLCAKVGIKDSVKSINQCKKVRHQFLSSFNITRLLVYLGPGSCPCEHRRRPRFMGLRHYPNSIQEQEGSCCLH